MNALDISFFSDLKAIFDIVFMIFVVFGPAQLDLYIFTDGALPLPAHLPSRIIANVKLAFFFCVVCTGYIKICHVVEVLMLIWSFLIYEPFFLLHFIFFFFLAFPSVW